jgi:uncharacterized protein (DUF983 family)
MEPLSVHPARPPFGQTMRLGLRMKCPCCGRGPLFRRPYRMYHECPLCGLGFYRESGYYVGAMIINYGVTAGIMIVAYLISRELPTWWHAPVNTKILVWMGAAVVLSLALVPWTRSLWLAIDYWVEPWEPAETLFRKTAAAKK